MYDVITVGSATVDAMLCTEHSDTLKGKQRAKFIAYPIGAKILVEDLILTVGGGGTNTAVALSRLGHKVAFIGKVGTSYNSRRICKELRKEKVDTRFVIQKKGSRTGYSVILDSYKHDRTILNYRGSNNDLRISEIPVKKLNTHWFYFSSMLGQSFKTLERLSEHANKNNIHIAFTLSSYLAKKGIKFLRKILKNTTILIMNKEESELLVGKGTITKNLKKLSRLGPKIVAITDGAKGTHALYKNHIYYGKPNKIKVVETTGAGDAFAASFLSGIIRKGDVEFAMKMGMTNAESVIQYHGAKNKLLGYKEALKVIKKKPVKVVKKRG